MNRPGHLVPVLLIVALAFLPQLVAAKAKETPRYSPPQSGQGGRVDIEQYYRIDDPKEAARILLEEARLAQVDIDQQWGDARNEIRLGSGPMIPDKSDRRFFEKAARQVTALETDTETICVIKCNRVLTIRETAEMMNQGIRIYRGAPFCALFARVPAAAARYLEEFDAVDWVGEFTPEMKYNTKAEFSPERAFQVYTLAGDASFCRDDLKRLGGEVIYATDTGHMHHRYDLYTIRIAPNQIPRVASLWWVQKIYQSGPSANEGEYPASLAADSLVVTSVPSSGFYPLDSRRLTSWLADARFDGYSQEILIYEFGCYWQHSDLAYQVLQGQGLSDLSTSGTPNDEHGTMVAGIAAGRYNTSVAEGGISGVADGARILYRKHVDTQEAIIGVEADRGYTISNHSWGMTDSVGWYTEKARDFDDFADTKDALIVKSAGNQQGGYVTSPGTGKNVLAVGGVYYVPNDAWGEVIGKYASDVSSIGPTREGMLKPELVAPCGSPKGGSCIDRGVVSTAPSGVSCKQWQTNYARNVGTSFAAPHVTGAAAITAQWYEDWYNNQNFQTQQTAGLVTSELLRAFLINSSVPLRWNGSFNGTQGSTYGALPGDTVATDELKGGFANIEYGFGLVNAYSGVNSSDAEWSRVRVWQGTVEGVGSSADLQFPLVIKNHLGHTVRPRYLVVTMAYDDLPGVTNSSNAIIDRLNLSLSDPFGRFYDFRDPNNAYSGTVQKIIVPYPVRGDGWTASVRFANTSSNRPSPRQDFAVVIDAMLDAPELQVSVAATLSKRVGTTFELPVTVRNVGGNVAAGVTVKVVDSNNILPPFGDDDKTVYLKNLVKFNDSGTVTFSLKAPVTPSPNPYTFEVEVDAINKMMDGGPYPIRKTVQIYAIDTRQVYGRIAMLPGFNQTVQGAQILVNDEPTGVLTDATGNYSVEVPKNFNGIVKPKKGTTVFIPEYKPYTNVTQDQPGQDYEAVFHTVSGFIKDENQQGVGGITVVPKPSPGSTLRASPSVVTQSGGSFTIYVEHGWTGKFEPQVNGTYANFAVVNPAHAHHDSIVSNVYSHNISTSRAVNWQPDGVLVATSGLANGRPQVVPDGAGGAVVVWSDDRSSETARDIWAQRVGPNGDPLWGGGQPICTAAGDQETPRIEKLDDGTFIVVWTDLRNGNRDIFAQRIDSNGEQTWSQNGIVVCQASGDQQNLQVIAGSTGDDVIAVWEDKRGGTSDIYAQRLLSTGVLVWATAGVAVCTAAADQLSPSVAIDEEGGVYVAWLDRRPGTPSNGVTYLQRLLSDGTAVFEADGMRPFDPFGGCLGHATPAVAVTSDNACLVAFYQCGDIKVTKVDASGQALWMGKSAGNPGHRNRSISLVGDESGGGVIAWMSATEVLQGCQYTSVPSVALQRLDATGERTWGGMDGAILMTSKALSDQPRVLKDGAGGYFVSWRQAPASCSGADSTEADVVVQHFDPTGARMWASGLVIAGAGNAQRNAAIESDLVSGLVACWIDSRVASQNAIYVARVNDTSQMFSLSGHVRASDGIGVGNLEVRALDDTNLLVARMSNSDGSFTLGVPAFWSGNVEVVPRGYFNTAITSVQAVGPMLSSVVRDFTVHHETTRWQGSGLAIVDDATDLITPSLLADSTGNLVAIWANDEQVSGGGGDADVYVQRVDPSGDILWTTGGDRVVAVAAREELPVAVPCMGNDVILLWRRAAEFVESGGGLWAERYSEPQQGHWGDDGVHLVDDLDISMFAACSDLAGGAFVCWFDESWCWLARLRDDGTLDWPSAVKLGYAGVSPPVMEPDSVGGVVLSWQYAGGGQNHVYVQRVNSNGQMLWGSGQPGEPLSVRGGFVNMNPGDFRMAVDPFGGALVAWTERSQPTSSDDRIRASWVYHDGTKFSGPNGVELPGSNDQMLISDLTLDDASHFFVLYREEVPGSPVHRLAVRRVEPDIFGGISDFWGASGKTIAAGGIYESRIFGRDPDGGCLVVWRDNYDLNATRLTADGSPAWIDREHRIASDVFGDVLATSDGARGAYVLWRGLTNSLYAARVSNTVLPNAEVAISSFVRGTNNVAQPISETHANGCPKGDEDDLVFRIELVGDLMESPPASAITLSSPSSASGVKFHRTETADSTLRLNGDHYRTTITVSEFSGCGEDSVEVRINDWVVGHARFNVKSPDTDRSGSVSLTDFANFAAHYPSTLCNCIYPKDYSHCVDFAPPDTALNVADFAKYGGHIDHEFEEGVGMPVVASSSGGDVALRFEEFEHDGQRRLRVAISLENVQTFSAGLVVLLNENPRLGFAEWRQNPLYTQTTICAPTRRDGKNELALGVLGTKNAPMGAIELGTIDMIVDSDTPFELTDEDLRLVSGEILDLDGNALAVSGRGRSLGPRRYDNWLAQNYPNPFNPTTTIAFSITKPGHVDLAIYDVTGALVRNLVKGSRKPNLYKVDWDGHSNAGSRVASGVYFYRLRAPGFTSSKKMVLLK